MTQTFAARPPVTINPNDPGYDLVLCIGQSNMAGYGLPLDLRLNPVNPRIYQYGASGTYAAMISQAQEPLAMVGSPTGASPAMEFSRWYSQTVPSNRRVLIVAAAKGSTSLLDATANGWNPSATGNLTDAAIAQANAALAAAGPNSRIVAILWGQGEADVAGNQTGTAYATALDALITKVRAGITGASTAPFVIGQMTPEYRASLAAAGPINTAQIEAGYRNQRVAFAYGPTGLTNVSEIIHYSAAGHRALGRSYFDTLAVAKANVTGVAPVVPAAPTLTQAGTTVNVTLSRPVGRVTDYAVRYQVDGGAWTTLSRARSIDTVATITGISLGSTILVQQAAVNEVGSSAWSASASLTMIALPAALSGLTAPTSGASSLGLSWSSAARAASYRVEYKLTPETPWTLFGTVTGLAATLVGLFSARSYDARVTPVNAAGDGPSATVTASTATPQALLSAVGVSALRGYGTRLLKSDYSGPLIQVRRTSDNTTQDIGIAGVDLDVDALATFVGSNSAYVSKIYDQSGGAKHLTQAAVGKQPRIVNAGVIDTLGGKPTMVFDGVDDYFTDANGGLYSAGAATALVVHSAVYAASAQAIWGEGASGSANQRYIPGYMAANGGSAIAASDLCKDDAGTDFASGSSGLNVTLNTVHQQSTVDTGTAITTWVDGTAGNVRTYSRSGLTVTLNMFGLGAQAYQSASRYFWGGKISEIVLFPAALTTGQRQAGESNQKGQYGTP